MMVRSLASVLCLLVTTVHAETSPVESTPGARRADFSRRPRIEFVVDGDPVFRVVPPDVITAIDEPEMIPSSHVEGIMSDDEPVLGVFDGERARAWSTWMLDSHEVVNDRLGDMPIAATWCPLANTGVVYQRKVAGQETTFGVSGMLWRDSLVLFDRKTETLWSQVAGKALHGPLRGASLTEVPAVTTTWGAWKRLHPGTLVLRPDERSRSGSPFADYFKDEDRLGITRSIRLDPRLPGKSLVVGIRIDKNATAVPLDTLAGRAVVQSQVGSTPVAILSVASRGAFGYDRRLSARILDFQPDLDGGIRDLQTGSTWDPENGRALTGPLAGERLTRVDSRSAYWFTWSTFHPSTEIVGQDEKMGESSPE